STTRGSAADRASQKAAATVSAIMPTMKKTTALVPECPALYRALRRRPTRDRGPTPGENRGGSEPVGAKTRGTRPARVTVGSGVALRMPQSWPLASRNAPFEGVWRVLRLGLSAPLAEREAGSLEWPMLILRTRSDSRSV